LKRKVERRKKGEEDTGAVMGRRRKGQKNYKET